MSLDSRLADDILSMIFAVSSLVPVFCIVALATLVLSRRDLHTISVFVLLLGNEAMNMALKQYWKEQRPHDVDATLPKAAYGKYGMPSSHSQFMGFVLVYGVLWVIVRWGLLSASTNFNGSFCRQNLTTCAKTFKSLEISVLAGVTAVICVGRWAASRRIST